MNIWRPRVRPNENLREITGQINIKKEIIERKYGWIEHTLRKDNSET
jgi:hypothetical protein